MATTPPRIVVVGAGLAGLIAGLEAANGGADVTVLDGAGHAGGRAHTTRDDGFHRNLGPHAVYRRGELARELRRLRVPVPGRSPRLDRARLLLDGEQVGAARVAARNLGVARLLRRRPAPGTTVTAWLDDVGLEGEQRSITLALLRTATYAHAPDLQDAVSARAQMVRSLGGVTYVHGGWRTLVDGLSAALTRAGGSVRTSSAVRAVHLDDRVRGVELADGRDLPADGVVVAVGGPREAGRLLDGEVGAALRARDDVPVRMATLDLAVDRATTRWPAQVIGGGDDPRYWLVPSRVADLAPEDGDLVHVARYLAPDERGDADTRADLEHLFDEVQPGWRDRVRHVRFLPNLTVTHALPSAAAGGLPGRAKVATGVRGLALAGDAFGAEGQLADAAAASGVRAARTVLADLAAGARELPAAGRAPHAAMP